MTDIQKDLKTAFQKAYKQLNIAQKEAVDTIEGPVMVVAGPGTGKTQILTLRIANILLKTDVQPENILALTFTESGAKAMRERLRRYIGAEAYRVPIYTFHGFAGQLIRQYPDAYENVIGGRPATDLDKISIIESILESGSYTLLRPMGNPQYYVTPILRMIGTLKQEYLTPDRFKEVIERQETELAGVEKVHEKGAHKGKVRGEYTKLEKVIAKNYELLAVYRQYETLLQDQKLYDFEDMLLQTVTALQGNEDMLCDLQETYQYVLADEHQDVNGTQNTLLELLVSYHDNPNIFAVGDEKQAIYRFQGASLENFLYFEEKFPGTKTISLTENYRSGQTVLDAAHSLVAVDDGPLKDLRVPLEAKAVSDSVVFVRDFSHQAVEDTAVVDTIQKAIADGVSPSEVAVIVRTNREVELYASLLRKASIPVTASADGDILSHPITVSILALIDAVSVSHESAYLFSVLHAPYWGISSSDLVRTMAAQSYKQPLPMVVTDAKILADAGVENSTAIMRVAEVLKSAREASVTEAPHRVLEILLKESGFMDHILETDPLEGVRVVRRLYDEIEELVVREGLVTLSAVAAALRTRQEYGLALNAPYIATNEEAVQVMTAHKSKGLEFEYVFVPHLIDSAWGGRKKPNLFTVPLTRHIDIDAFDPIDDERRLLFVGMTRAKTHLYLSSSEKNAEGKELTPSRLLADLAEETLTVESTAESEAVFDPVASLAPQSAIDVIDTDLITSLVASRGFSATSINNYLRSPWDYFYRNLLRIPEIQPVHMQYGTVVHNVLERVTSFHTKEQALPSDTQIKDWLESELGRLPITTTEYTRLHEKAMTSLLTYIGHVAPDWSAQTREELSINVTLETGVEALPEIKLSGKLDRLDLNEGGTALRVVDYKTGKPKTRNAIEGNTKTDDGGYKRQLVFYALLLELYDDDRYKTRTGVLSFVEADSKGVIHEELFTVTDEEVEALKEEIVGAVEALTSGSFLAEPADGSENYSTLVEQLLERE